MLEGPAEAKFEGIFDSFAAGTFFYIAVMDILADEFKGAAQRWARYAVAIFGFTVMAIVAI